MCYALSLNSFEALATTRPEDDNVYFADLDLLIAQRQLDAVRTQMETEECLSWEEVTRDGRIVDTRGSR